MRKKAKWFSAIFIVLLLGFFLLPVQQFAAHKITDALEAKGFAPVIFTIDHLGLKGITLKDVALGNPALKLASVTVDYQPRALLKGQIETAEINGLTINMLRDTNGWAIDGMAGLSKKPSEKPAAIPVTLAELRALPVASISLKDAKLHAADKGWQMDLPLNGKLQHQTDATLQLESDHAAIQLGADKIDITKFQFNLALDETKQQWHGKWNSEEVNVQSETMPLPKLKAAGELMLQSDKLLLTGEINSADNSHALGFTLAYSLTNPAASIATITHAAMPISGGSIGVRRVAVPLSGTKPIAVTLNVEKVAIDSVMQALTGSQAKATGVVSGNVPLIVTREGKISVGKGALKADAPGVIQLAPEAIPGDNPQVTLVRDILKNLQYTVLALNLEMTPEGALTATLAVEGRNPDVEKGRPIKLQVHLSGDLLNLITQNLKLMTDPKTFIEQNAHAKDQ